MRTLVLVVLIVLVVLATGCSSAPARSNPNQNDSAGGELPPTETAPAATSLDGRWFGLELGDDDVELALDFAGDTVILSQPWGRDPTERHTAHVARRADGLVELSLAGEDLRLLIAPQSADAALAFAMGEDEVRWLRRAVPVPPALQGAWHFADPEDDRAPIAVDVSGDRIRYVENDRPTRGGIFGLGASGPAHDVVIVLAPSDGASGRAHWTRFVPVGPDVFLVTRGGDDRFLVAHRPGRPPDWLRVGPSARE